MAELHVEMYGVHIGDLFTTAKSSFDFRASDAALRRFGFGSRILSLSTPLVRLADRRGLAARKNFFAELLPEGDARARMALIAGIADKDDVIGMLRAYGRDVAGALQIWDASDPSEPRTPRIESVDELGVEQMLKDSAIAPLGNTRTMGKTSLNGVQSKIVLVKTDDGWARALDGYPSTHILKPIVSRVPTMIFDEEYGSRFARGLGLADFGTEIVKFNDTSALVIERYDRDPFNVDGRIHQEDFNQVLGLAGDQKYERYGQKSLRDVAAILNPESRERLLRMTTLSVALGNLDFHAKNISLLHQPEDTVELAPMYDVVPQVHLENDGEMALYVGGEPEHRLITKAHLVFEGGRWDVEDAEAIIDETLTEIEQIAETERPLAAAQPSLQWDVQRFVGNLISGRAAGDDGNGNFDPTPAPPTTSGGAWNWNAGGNPGLQGRTDAGRYDFKAQSGPEITFDGR